MSETTINEDLELKSPVRKLARFFRKSRDGWKRKHHEMKARCKKLSNQVRAVERSRQLWKERVKEQQRRVGELERELEAQKGVA